MDVRNLWVVFIDVSLFLDPFDRHTARGNGSTIQQPFIGDPR